MGSDDFASIIGQNVSDRSTNYGTIKEIRQVIIEGADTAIAILSSGKAMRMTTLHKLFESQNKFITRRDDDGSYYVMCYPDGTDFAKQTFGARRKRQTSLYPGGYINVIAKIKDQRIDITTYVASRENINIPK
jgi:hypothetical protein